MDTLPFIIASEKIYLEINLTKGLRDHYNGNVKPLKKEIVKGTKKLGVLCSWIGRINIVKMTILPKATYRSNVISIKIPISVFREIEKIKFV